MSNADVETRWVDAWNDLNDVLGDRVDVPCQLPDSSVVSFEECRGWLQDSVYAGYHVRVEAGWVGHRRGAIVCTKSMLATHDGVVEAQRELDELSRPFGGRSDAWGTQGNADG